MRGTVALLGPRQPRARTAHRPSRPQPIDVPVRRAFRPRGITAHAVLPAPSGWVPLCSSNMTDDPDGRDDWRGWQTPGLIAEAAELPTCAQCARAIPARL